MLQNKLIPKNYTGNSGVYQLVLPLNMEVLIPKEDSVRLSHITEELDYTNLIMAYSSKGRNPEVKPKTLIRVLVYAYMNDIYTSRKIEEACRRDINFMWLLQGKKVPGHNTIARFRKCRLQELWKDYSTKWSLNSANWVRPVCKYLYRQKHKGSHSSYLYSRLEQTLIPVLLLERWDSYVVGSQMGLWLRPRFWLWFAIFRFWPFSLVVVTIS